VAAFEITELKGAQVPPSQSATAFRSPRNQKYSFLDLFSKSALEESLGLSRQGAPGLPTITTSLLCSLSCCSALLSSPAVGRGHSSLHPSVLTSSLFLSPSFLLRLMVRAEHGITGSNPVNCSAVLCNLCPPQWALSTTTPLCTQPMGDWDRDALSAAHPLTPISAHMEAGASWHWHFLCCNSFPFVSTID